MLVGGSDLHLFNQTNRAAPNWTFTADQLS